MDVSFFIASRLKFKGRMAMICISVSFLVMIIAVAVSSGFRYEIRKGLADISGDIQITPVDLNYLGGTSPIERHPAYMNHVYELPEVEAVNPVVYRAGIIKTEDNIHGVLFKGVGCFHGDSLAGLEVSIPTRLSELLSLKEGDELTTYFVGEKVKVRKFKVRSIHNALVEVDEKLVVYASLGDVQRVNEWGEDEVSAFEVKLKERYRTESDMVRVNEDVGFMAFAYSSEDEETVVCSSAVRMYPQLFDWLNLIDFNVLFILILMTIVAGFNMISGLLIMLFENISTIGLLKALGMTDRSIAKVFLASSSTIVLKGMVVGNLLAFAICLVENLTHFFRLDPANYFVSYMPVHIDFGLVLGADFVAYVVIMLLLLIPSLFIARVDPAKTVTVK